MGVENMKTEAANIEKFLVTNPGATVQELSEQTEIPEEEVSAILDEWFVGDDGKPSYKGVGLGGGWTPARQFEAELAAQEAVEG